MLFLQDGDNVAIPQVSEKVGGKSVGSMRLLIIGAGASLEEATQSGNANAQPFPTIRNMGSYWMVTGLSACVHIACAAYLDSKGITYNKKVLELFTGDRESLAEEEGGNAPLQVFQKAAHDNPQDHNVETVCEFVWQNQGQRNKEFWASFAEHTVYLPLFGMQFEHFFENGVGWKQLRASHIVAKQLSSDDRIINLNYDTVFEIGAKQLGMRLSYFPNKQPNEVLIYKPHGSINLYVNPAHGDMYFVEPDEIYGTFHLPDQRGGTFHPSHGIIPPRLNKSYAQHPVSAWILEDAGTMTPDVVTFWGVGLTSSDKDLEDFYIAACKKARRIEFINPDEEAYKKVCSITGTIVTWFQSLDAWATATTAE